MTSLLLAVQWLHLAACVMLVGTLFLQLLAGQPASGLMRDWQLRVGGWARRFVLTALLSGIAVLAIQTALFEGRPQAALDPLAVGQAMLATRPGFVWLVRLSLLAILTGLLWLDGDAESRTSWFALRVEAFVLAAAALALQGRSGHLAALSDDPWLPAVDMLHLLAAGMWVGGLPPLAALLLAASRSPPPLDPVVLRTASRFSGIALLAVATLVASGFVGAWLLTGGVAGLLGTDHGRYLIAKLVILVPTLALAALTRRRLPDLAVGGPFEGPATARRMGWFVAIEAALLVVLVGFAAAMTVTPPARHGDPVWPLPFRLTFAGWSGSAAAAWLNETVESNALPVLAGLALLVLAFMRLALRRPVLSVAMALLLSFGAAAMLRPTVSLAVPTSFTRPAVSYSVSSVAAGMDLYAGHCASCHGPLAPGSGGEASASDLLTPEITDRSAGELFWAVTRGRPDRGMPAFADTLTDAQRWQLINAVRAAEASARARMVGPVVEFDGAWLPAPDFTVAVGPLLPRRLSEFRGRKMVLLVLYQLPLSRERLTDLAKRYGSLSVLGVEVVAVGPASSPDRIAELGQTPPILFPIVTDANEEIASVYGLFAPRGAHRELLIDRQGYIRAVWDTDEAGMPSADAVQAQVERLNEEKSPPPVPDDHVH